MTIGLVALGIDHGVDRGAQFPGRPLCWAADPVVGSTDPRKGGAEMAKTPQVGEQAPDFELAGTEGPFKLSGHRGERVVLLFYPGDNTPVCTRQFCSYAERKDDVSALDATDLATIHQFLDRRLAMPIPVRAYFANQLAARVGPKVPGVPYSSHPEYLLEGIVVAKQARA